jgi:uncharacterized membrane protein YphA (DoxX/SURF4 family)
MAKKHILFFTALVASLLPLFASAHEVYVLPSGEIIEATHEASFNMVAVAMQQLPEFVLYFIICIITVAVVLWISTRPTLKRLAHPVITAAKKYAPFIARVTIGIAFLACAYYQAIFGPELPLASIFGAFSPIVTAVLVVVGIMIILGFYARLAALAALILFCSVVAHRGIYALTYVNYLGEIIVLLILGAGHWSLDTLLAKKTTRAPIWFKKIRDYLAPRSFAILRVLFGVALIFASAYAKIIYNNLALLTVEQYHLDKILGFEPHFLVVGAACVELLIGIFFIIGFELRFTALFFLFWLTLSLIFFGEAVWPHFILIGIPIAYLCYGYDRYSLGWHLSKDKKYEPVL